jgi:hypothetical protein
MYPGVAGTDHRAYHHWKCRITPVLLRRHLKGDTVVKMQPIGPEEKLGYSDFEKKEVPVFYGETGLARLYQRKHFVADARTALSTLYPDDGSMNFWKLDGTNPTA